MSLLRRCDDTQPTAPDDDHGVARCRAARRRWRTQGHRIPSNLLAKGDEPLTAIFVNGQKVFQGDATCIGRDIQFLGTVSMKDAMALPLKKGANQVVLVARENYAGWAAAAELTDAAGLSGPALAAEGR
jgi:hypothetical protein